MQIEIRKSPPYHTVKIRYGSTTIDLGIFSEGDRKELAQVLLAAAEKLLSDLTIIEAKP